MQVAYFLMAAIGYTHLAQVTGSSQAAELLRDICGRMKLAGGADHDGHHWVWLSAEDASKIINSARNTAARYLRLLVEMGFLVREKLGQATRYGRNRSWYYRLGPACPDFLLSKGSRKEKATHCATAAQSTKNHSTIPTQQKPVAHAQERTAPTAEQAQAVIEERRNWPLTLRELGLKEAPIPAETRQTTNAAGSNTWWARCAALAEAACRSAGTGPATAASDRLIPALELRPEKDPRRLRQDVFGAF